MIKIIKDFLIIKHSKIFDGKYYLRTYPDVEESMINPLIHFIIFGWKENRNPSIDFDTSFYLNHYQDVKNAKINPLVHYIINGRKEGRVCNAVQWQNRSNQNEQQQWKEYNKWIKGQKITDEDRKSIRLKIQSLNKNYKFSVVMAVHNPCIDYLTTAIESVKSQLYTNWELCICDDASNEQIIEKLKEFANGDERIILINNSTKLGFSDAMNKGLSLVTGEFIGIIYHEDLLDESALFYIADALNINPEIDLIYSDNDYIDESENRLNPIFKPDWSPNTLLSLNYIKNFITFRKSKFYDVATFRNKYIGAQDYDLILRLTEKTKNIKHIYKILYSFRSIRNTENYTPFPSNISSERDVVQDAIFRRKEDAEVMIDNNAKVLKINYRKNSYPLISVIISSCNIKQLEKCCRLLHEKTIYENYEVLVATNLLNNKDMRLFSKEHGYKLVEVENGFFSKMNNEAANQSAGEFLVFLNDDTEVVTNYWLEELITQCQRESVGAVGPKLIYPDKSIQFTRMVLGIKRDGTPVFADPFQLHGLNYVDGFAENHIADVSAISGACFMISKEVFNNLGQFNQEEFNIAWQDIDLCFRLREEGYSIIYTPYSVLIHYGASTKKNDHDILRTDVEQANIFFEMYKRRLSNGDPFYNVNLMDINSYREIPRFPGIKNINVSDLIDLKRDHNSS